jgi:nucleoside-diphosphate-sugar epimerase
MKNLSAFNSRISGESIRKYSPCNQNMAKTRVLLTGADTLTGSHILAQLLSQDTASVRAVVQSRDAAQAIHEHYHRCLPSSLDFVALPSDDQMVYGTMENALCDPSRPFEAVLHTLIPKHSDAADCLSTFVKLETEELLRFLSSVQHTAHYVRRVVLVTSLVPFARWLVQPPTHRDPEQDLGQESPPLAVDVEHILATSQASSSTLYDDILQWMKISGAHFDITFVSTPSVYGPSVHPLETSSDLSETNRRIWNICSNEPPERTEIPPHGITHYADVRVSCR